jgi:predicted ABC-type ATPase
MRIEKPLAMARSIRHPTAYVIAGPNGAGKTTYSPRVDSWWLYDSSDMPPIVIAENENGRLTEVDAKLFGQIQRAIED